MERDAGHVSLFGLIAATIASLILLAVGEMVLFGHGLVGDAGTGIAVGLCLVALFAARERRQEKEGVA